jgi:predicted RNA binding protein YcfA (HicA-like mRNA interferase family)
MGRLPVLKPREVIAILEARGFAELRQRAHTNNSDIPTAAAPRFRYILEEISPPILLRQIAKDIGLTIEKFLKSR